MNLDERIQRNPDAGLAAIDWATAHADELAAMCKAVGVSPLEFGGPIIDAAMLAACRGDLDTLTPRLAVQRARDAAKHAKAVVTRGHRTEPCAVHLDCVPDEELLADADPLDALLAAEAEREREDLDDDHDDRPSRAARRCARGLPPEPPRPRGPSPRTLRRRRANARLIACAQIGFRGAQWESA